VIAMMACVAADRALTATFAGSTNFCPQGPGGRWPAVYEKIGQEILGDFGTMLLLGAVYVSDCCRLHQGHRTELDGIYPIFRLARRPRQAPGCARRRAESSCASRPRPGRAQPLC